MATATNPKSMESVTRRRPRDVERDRTEACFSAVQTADVKILRVLRARVGGSSPCPGAVQSGRPVLQECQVPNELGSGLRGGVGWGGVAVGEGRGSS